QRCLEQVLIDMCIASQGRALVLFTSHSALRSTYRVLQPRLEERGILVLGHAIDGSRHRILNQFKQNAHAVLLGTTSFWEGIDVIGDALSLLVITKLPFSVPTDPVFAARAEQFDDGFEQYSVPQAILRFKQGFGRLIRSHQDHGVVAILDRRVMTKNYGAAFLDSLPTCRVTRTSVSDISGEISRWLAVAEGAVHTGRGEGE
ncbi:MAG: DNA polymerase III subunit epsilon, partial [Chloroflexi bacterium]|nr:DNA polymerase III subunit epsilon [Chloroflexota bacterium]